MAAQPGDPEALLLYQLIGAPMLAVVQAEAQAAQVSAEFIQRVGFVTADERRTVEARRAALPPGNLPAGGEAAGDKRSSLQDGGDVGNLRTAEFVMHRIDDTGQERSHVISVPVLSLFPIPLLQVKDAEFDFDVRILTRVPLQNPDDLKKDLDTGHAPAKDFLAAERVELKGMLAPKGGGEAGALQMGMKVKIRMEQADIPAGLLKLMNIMDQGVSLRAAPESPEQTPGGLAPGPDGNVQGGEGA